MPSKPGDDYERHEDDGEQQLDHHRVDPLHREELPEAELYDNDAEHDEARSDTARTEAGHSAESLVFAGDAAASENEDDGDEDERHRRRPTGGLNVPRDLRLCDADGQARQRRDWERRESADHCGGEHRNDKEDEKAGAEPRNGDQKNEGQRRECATYGSVRRRDHVGRDGERRGRARVLGDCGGRDPERGEFVDGPQSQCESQHENQDPHAVLADRRPKMVTRFVGNIDGTRRVSGP